MASITFLVETELAGLVRKGFTKNDESKFWMTTQKQYLPEKYKTGLITPYLFRCSWILCGANKY